jgi:ATP-dependent DNA helicase RecG
MRPEILFPIFSPVTKLNGIGPRIAALIEKLTGPNMVAILWHLPNGIIDRRNAPKIVEAKAGEIATITVTVDQHIPPKSKRLPYKIICSDNTGSITLVFFHSHKDYLNKSLPEGEKRVISGSIEKYGDGVQMPHPDYVVSPTEFASIPAVEPVYPLTQGLSLKVLVKAIKGALAEAPQLPEWLDKPYLKQQKWPSWNEALAEVHNPISETHLEPQNLARQRLAYDELLANQLALALIRANIKKQSGRSIIGTNNLKTKILESLTFKLTNSQSDAISEITQDMSSEGRMHRLLQGDVGSGKTLVALLSMIHAIESGAQAAILAPLSL